jgi:putative cardiolipin synthase
VGTPGPDGAADLQARFAATRADLESVTYLEAVRAMPLVRELLAGQLALEWSSARLVHDDPAKTLDTTDRADVLLFPELVRTIGRPEKTLDLVSPYFVPGDEGTESLAALARSGVKVRVLTNSLASAEAGVVHAGYAKRRHDLLRAGMQLFELKPTAVRESHYEKVKTGSSSSAGLHAKTFAVDRSRVFVGSFNFDQRSAKLNTEMGLVIDNPSFARRMAEKFDTDAPRVAYEVRLGADGQSLEWIERSGSGETRHGTEPGTSWWQRFTVDFYSILPIDWML